MFCVRRVGMARCECAGPSVIMEARSSPWAGKRRARPWGPGRQHVEPGTPRSEAAVGYPGRIVRHQGFRSAPRSKELKDAWNAAVGEPQCHQTRVGEVRRGVLNVTVAHSTLLEELAASANPHSWPRSGATHRGRPFTTSGSASARSTPLPRRPDRRMMRRPAAAPATGRDSRAMDGGDARRPRREGATCGGERTGRAGRGPAPFLEQPR